MTMKRNLRQIPFGILILLALVTFAACVPADGAQGSIVNLQNRTLKVGTDATYPPFEFVDRDQNLVGFDIDLVTEICQHANCRAVFVADSATLLPLLQNQTYDLSASAWTITVERATRMDFSIPYIPNTQVMLVRRDETRFQEPTDLKNPQFIVAVPADTTNALAARQLVADPKKQIKEFQDFITAVAALESKHADAVLIDTFAASATIVERKGRVRLSGKPYGNEYFGFVFRKGDNTLREAFNAGLKLMFRNGTWTRLCEKWWKGIEPKPDCTGKGLPDFRK